MIGALSPYPEMRPSGIEWLPALPQGWEIHRAKYSFKEADDRSEAGGEELLSVSHKTGVTPRSQKNITMFMAESYEGHKVCRPGDIVVNTMWAWMAAIGVSRHVGIVSPAYGIYRPRASGRFEPKFLDYLLRTEVYRAEYLRSSRGVTTSRLRLYPPDFLNIPLVQPPLDEQRLIVRLLDWHGAQTAKLIRAKKKIIALLNEQRQAIIHRAVTRGHDTNIRFKPSGIPWLGDVPEGWEVKRLKWAMRLQRGFDLPADRRIPGPHPVVSSGGIIDYHVDARVKGPGVVMGRYGSTDAVFYIEHDFWPHNTSLFVTDFCGNLPWWCFYILRTISKQDHSSKAAVPGVDRKDLFDIVVAVPPRLEQSNIVKGIEDSSRDLNQAITTISLEIGRIQEFRARLIADVVTGKLDVRAMAATMSEVPDAEPIEDVGEDDGFDGEHAEMEGEEVAA
ncbi:restriction endonuclease subunit S [Mesorhizobium sp. M2E.F.Ca.ET.209.01.1.1]|uniref:restriction endonuclease subunit S n=1 Tax=Mesorhizobium sp. M2E.F.Ca.ET.209.01.1.1 TaxID=2500526 RepID=UPI000FD85797|nr:restriction endonuclease subunit S [Mesorhizobium sp. M2E.F.Ca.ET.209.01.1.1]TGS08816.1 restriction endonuclease subunit S [Mesorhizobium sp. M2E.F.Ca.ET.209.01.1.1]